MLKKFKSIYHSEKGKYPDNTGIVLLFKIANGVLRYHLVETYRKITKNSIFFLEDEMFMCSLFPQKTLDILIESTKMKSILDVGCGRGVTLAYFLENGIDAVGIEGSKIAIKGSKYPDKILRKNLNKEINLNRKFDVVWTFEVAEHIHPNYLDQFLNTCTRHSDLVVISAAKPGQGGHGHFNEKPFSYWLEKFKSIGFAYDETLTDRLKSTNEVNTENLMVYYRIK